MPLVDSNQAALWDGGVSSLYRCRIDGQIVGYTRAAKQQYYGNDVDTLIAALNTKGLVQGQRIALVGAGFGWAAERFVELGYGPIASGTAGGKVCSIDTSTWIQANKGNGNATTTIIDADVNGATGRRTIRQQFGSNNADIDWAISEDVLPCLTGVGSTPGGNNEIVPFVQSLRALADNVAHWVTTGVRRFDNPNVWVGDSRLNWKTLEEWKAWVTPDYIVQRNGGSIL